MSSHRAQSLSFIICGIIGATIEFSIIHLGVDILGWSPYVTYFPSALIPSIFVFFFNKHVTFKAKGTNSTEEMRRFVLVYTFAFFLNYLLSSLFFFTVTLIKNQSEFLASLPLLTEGNSAIFAKAGAIGCCAFLNYFLSHTFIFANRSEHARLATTL
jgi:putative flippase GtrA